MAEWLAGIVAALVLLAIAIAAARVLVSGVFGGFAGAAGQCGGG